MADTKISGLTAATTPLAGTEVLPIVQSGTTKQVSVANLTAGRAVSADSLTLANALTAANGGTGQSSYTIGDLLYASGATALSKLADVATGNALISGGVGVAPSWGKIGLATHVSGTLGTANGGTGLSSFTANGVVYASSTSALATGSGLTFDGTNLSTTGSATATGFIPSSNTVTSNGMFLPAANTLGFSSNSTERSRFSSSGYFKATSTGSYIGTAGVYHEFTASGADYTLYNRNTNAAPYGTRQNYSGAAPNGTGNEFLVCDDTGATRASIRSNGGLANYQANNVNLSDQREKTNIEPAKNYLDIICAIPVQTFNYIDQSDNDPGKTLGVIAQDVQAVAPEFVMESNWASKDQEPKMRLSVYETDLKYALMKALQELKAQFDEYKASHP